MTRTRFLGSFLLSAILCTGAIACGSSTTVTVPSVTPERCLPSFDTSQRSFNADGGTSVVAVTVSRECSWSASPEASWIAITSGAQGQGDGSVAFRVAPNPAPLARSSGIMISGQRLPLVQQAGACRFEVTSPPASVSAAGASFQMQIGTHTSCEWSARSDVSWISVTPGSGRGPASVAVTIARNAGARRSGQMLVASVHFTVTQPSPQGPEVELDGLVAGLSGSCPNLTFLVGITTVITDEDTTFKGGNCRDMRNFNRVEVEGRRQPDGHVLAFTVELNP